MEFTQNSGKTPLESKTELFTINLTIKELSRPIRLYTTLIHHQYYPLTL